MLKNDLAQMSCYIVFLLFTNHLINNFTMVGILMGSHNL